MQNDAVQTTNYNFIIKVLERFEGAAILKGYVPCSEGKPLDNSGVTIGTGIDLGQQNYTSLVAMGIPMKIIEKFLPYLGKKKNEAMAILGEHPLRLTKAEVKTLDIVVTHHYINNMAKTYNRDAKTKFFHEIPQEAQAVICSLGYQFGSPKRFPKTWDMLCAEKWKEAAAELKNPAAWNNKYTKRRMAEGDILLRIA